MEPIRWFDRKFDFDFSENIFPEILQRLRATPGKLTQWIHHNSPELLGVRFDNSW